MLKKLQYLYEFQIRERSHWLLIWLAVAVAFLAFQARHFTLDASAESLILEEDVALDYFREISSRYGSQEFLVLTFTPYEPLFSESSLATLTRLRDDIRDLEQIASVVSVMDVPLLSNPPVPLSELVTNIKTLEDPSADISMARSELANSPLYVNLLLNLEANTTALQINFPLDKTRSDLFNLRADLKAEIAQQPQSAAVDQLELVEQLIFKNNADSAARLHQNIKDIRRIIARYEDAGELYLGGVPMIADDIIGFVRNDLMLFGAAAFVLIIVTLITIFRQKRWVILPLVCACAVVIAMLGFLGWWRWPVTIISSNVVSLLLILTLSMNIHLVVRYRELLRKHPEWTQGELVVQTVRQIAVPCVYMTLTTGVAFVSLLASGIRPVISFGWMMMVGISIAFVMTFLLFPSLLMRVGKDQSTAENSGKDFLTRLLARFTLRNGQLILICSLLILAFTVMGASRLIVENSFIDYFDESTEIYQGMTVIDQRLGGTTPLEVIINFNGDAEPKEILVEREDRNQPPVSEPFEESFVDESFADFVNEDFLMMDESDIGSFEDDFVGEDDPNKYWFTTSKVEAIKKIHHYLDGLPETGKVISLATMIEIAESFNAGEPLSNLQLALLYSVIPEEFRAIVVDPYVSVENDEARLNVRIIDSMQGLQRNELIARIEADMTEQLGFAKNQVKLTGMMVLYNNMLQSLFSSQLLTLGVVFSGILLMFLLLFRNLKLAAIAMIPNLLAATLVLGVMGWLGIPLDIMTITIASITIGIAVDNTIHYIVRYQTEYKVDQSYPKALKRAHDSIGKAIFYTSIAIIMGFSILALSNFKPTIYFGVLTALAMAVALLGSLTLLPRLILLTKPF